MPARADITTLADLTPDARNAATSVGSERVGAFATWVAADLTDEQVFGSDGIRAGFHQFLLTKGQVSVAAVICRVAERLAPCTVDALTWTICGPEAEMFRALVDDGSITRFRLVMDRIQESRQKSRTLRCSWLMQAFDPETFRVTRNHAKCAVVRGQGYSVAVLSSGNLNANPRCEFVDIADDPAIADTITGLVDEVFRTHPAGFAFGAEGQTAFELLMSGEELEQMIRAQCGGAAVGDDECADWGASTPAVW